VFSPPNTRIEVSAERVGTGLVAEVEDRGLGLSPDELDDINARLASPAEFDLTHSEQLGLFVVSRLAARHDIKVSLRRSVYGGTTAVVLLPFGVVVRREQAGPAGYRDDQPDDTLIRGLTGRHRMPAIGSGRGADGAKTAERDWPAAPWETGPLDRTAEAPRPLPPQMTAATPTGPASSPAPVAKPPWEIAAAPWPSAPEPGTPDATAGSMPSGKHLGMPIRVPQASLAPQLRARGAGSQPPQPPQAPAEDTTPDPRSPEATRNMLTLMQQGWRRGRVDDLDDPEGAPGSGTD
jgi:hypothetical protein